MTGTLGILALLFCYVILPASLFVIHRKGARTRKQVTDQLGLTPVGKPALFSSRRVLSAPAGYKPKRIDEIDHLNPIDQCSKTTLEGQDFWVGRETFTIHSEDTLAIPSHCWVVGTKVDKYQRFFAVKQVSEGNISPQAASILSKQVENGLFTAVMICEGRFVIRLENLDKVPDTVLHMLTVLPDLL